MEDKYKMLKDKRQVTSSTIESIEYTFETNALEVVFLNGSRYRYYFVPNSVFEDFANADSQGKYFAKNIRNTYEYEKMTEE